jgi:putative ABC transport system substrate-binding protein
MKANVKLPTWGVVLALALALFFQAPPSFGAEQSAKVARIGFLVAGGPANAVREPALRQRLEELSYIDGKNMVIETRYAEGKPERLPELAAELVRLKVDAIVAFTNVCAFAAKNATSTIPIVVWGSHGAVETGLVASLARPGGNVTGVESLAPELDAKRIELLKEIVPGLSQLAVLYDAGDQGSPLHLKWTQAAGRALSVAVSRLEVRRPEDFDTVFSTVAGKRLDGLLMFTGALTASNWKRVADFAHKNRLPTMCEFKYLADAGCLVSYGPTYVEFAQRTADQIDKILKGAKPADLPMEQPTRLELVVNLKTAKALGVTIPQSVLVRADRVIE